MKSKELKKKEAELRQENYNKLTRDEKIKRLIPGGSTKQRRKMCVS